MYSIENIKLSHIYFEEISYTEKINNAKDINSTGVEVSFSINNLCSEIGAFGESEDNICVIKNNADIQLDSNDFILRAKLVTFFDIIGIDYIDKEKVLAEKKYFDNLILISLEETREELNSKLNKLLEFTKFSPEEKYDFWKSPTL